MMVIKIKKTEGKNANKTDAIETPQPEGCLESDADPIHRIIHNEIRKCLDFKKEPTNLIVQSMVRTCFLPTRITIITT